jgi:HD-GYP domain-containing protein (c-di-GMP phosphodiesterase class II)
MCIDIGRALGLPESEINKLELFAMLHDIGKIAIDDYILVKPGSLNDDEFAQIKRHSEIGYRISQSTPELSQISEYILTHHERWDGKGYPQGLAGEEIPLLSRILSIADSFDAMTNDRVYRNAMSIDEAIKEIQSNAGRQFDPNIVSIFLNVVNKSA